MGSWKKKPIFVTRETLKVVHPPCLSDLSHPRRKQQSIRFSVILLCRYFWVKFTLRFNRLQTGYSLIMLSKLSIFASLASIAVSSSYKIATPVSASGSSATLSPAGSPIAVSSVAGTVLTNASSSVYSGLGTWYGGTCGESGCWQKGACAFVDYVLPATIDGSTCVAEEIWNNGYHCGACVEIMYNGKKKIAMVRGSLVEYCPSEIRLITNSVQVTNKTGGNATHLDMTPDMFSQIADKSLGGINIKWDFVPCPISAPLEIRMHSGASKWWFAATVENATLRTAKMEVSADSGNTWKATTRNVNNFFELSSTGGGTSTTTAWIRVTSENGSEVVIENVNMAAGTVATATTNYS